MFTWPVCQPTHGAPAFGRVTHHSYPGPIAFPARRLRIALESNVEILGSNLIVKAVIGERLARTYFENENPVGRHITLRTRSAISKSSACRLTCGTVV
jgi:hypothetical protein